MKKSILPGFLLLCILIGSHLQVKELMGQSSDMDKRMITVSGEGELQAIPDMATVRFGIYVRNDDPEEARRINAETSREAMNLIRGMGIEESKLSLQTLRLQPLREYDPETRRQVDRGYEATRDLVVVVENLELLPSIMAGIVQKGANRVNGITYGLKNKEEIRDQALVQAVGRAKAKAILMAGALGVEVGPVLSISEQSFSMPMPVVNLESAPRVMMAKSDAAPEPEAYAAGEIEVRAVVQVVFQLQ